MLDRPLARTIRRRLFLCVVLFTPLLAAGASGLPALAQPLPSSPSDMIGRNERLTPLGTLAAQKDPEDYFATVDTSATSSRRRYWWVSGGVGGSRMGFGYSFATGISLGGTAFLGGRYVYSKQLLGLFEPGPPEIFRDVGPLAGLLWKGQYGHVALGSGIVVVRGRQHGKLKKGEVEQYEARPRRTVGAPIDVQAFVMLTPHVGLGVHGYATVTSGENMRGLSVQFMVGPR